MDFEKAEKAKRLLDDHGRLSAIKIKLQSKKYLWITSEPSNGDEFTFMPEVLIEEFKEALDRSFKRIDKQIEEL
ncbi:MAG: hypothetical protein HXN36_02985 [Prevotella histicola]|jgi:hypothetical protein|uniref:hypothetical protein n=1 Tax=Prevotella histicola TaxID=470565 RepID=UPI001CAC06E3|nr:hypothetical protein [Prevotella histicola]MBF1393903.1 hypothetical protein [Prevotella histicola]